VIYSKLTGVEFFKTINTEEKAREWFWQARYGKKNFKCRKCQNPTFYALRSYPEIRTCKKCDFQNRLRAGTIFERSQLPLLVWMNAIYLVTKRTKRTKGTKGTVMPGKR